MQYLRCVYTFCVRIIINLEHVYFIFKWRPIPSRQVIHTFKFRANVSDCVVCSALRVGQMRFCHFFLRPGPQMETFFVIPINSLACTNPCRWIILRKWNKESETLSCILHEDSIYWQHMVQYEWSGDCRLVALTRSNFKSYLVNAWRLKSLVFALWPHTRIWKRFAWQITIVKWISSCLLHTHIRSIDAESRTRQNETKRIQREEQK